MLLGLHEPRIGASVLTRNVFATPQNGTILLHSN
jgi:hypothetical protein